MIISWASSSHCWSTRLPRWLLSNPLAIDRALIEKLCKLYQRFGVPRNTRVVACFLFGGGVKLVGD